MAEKVSFVGKFLASRARSGAGALSSTESKTVETGLKNWDSVGKGLNVVGRGVVRALSPFARRGMTTTEKVLNPRFIPSLSPAAAKRVAIGGLIVAPVVARGMHNNAVSSDLITGTDPPANLVR